MTPEPVRVTGARGTRPPLERPVIEFVRALRSAGVPVGVDGVSQALRALDAIATTDRRVVRQALAATLLSSSRQRAAFDALFDRYFGGAPVEDGASGRAEARGPRRAGGAHRRGDADHRSAERPPSDGQVAAGAEQRDRRGEVDGRTGRTGTPVGSREAPGVGGDGAAGGRWSTGAPTGVRGYGRIDLMGGDGAVDEEALASGVRELARLSRSRPRGRRRPGRRGRLDLRATIRRSLVSGGALIDPVVRPERPRRPRLVLLADVSGSMGPAARLALLVCHAFHREFSAIRSFAFVDVMEEITRFVERSSADARSAAAGADDALARAGGSTSDYGSALASLWPDHVSVFTPRTGVIVLGDARTNYRPDGSELLAEVRRRAHRLFWLNPEPRAYWGRGDSVADVYAQHCDRMVECRTVEQLVEAVVDLAASGTSAG